MESAGPRIGELERALEEQDAKEHLLLDHMLHSALSARAEELECCVADSLTELHREFEITRSLLEAVESTELELEAARLRGAELDQQLQLRTEEQRALAAASSARVLELEGELARCSEELREVRDEYSQLTDRCRAAAGLVEEREQQFAKISASMEALDYAIQSCHEEIRASEGLIDELAESRVTARFQRRSHTRSQPLPALYLKGLAQGDLILALQGLLGDVEPLSAESVARLASRWHDAHKAWKQLLIGREVAYLWADGVHLEAGSERESIELLVVVAAFVDGSRSVIAVELGERGSKETWLALMQDLARRGMNTPRIAIADSALGLWAALDELGWDCARQYCWNYKAAEVQAALPKKRHAQASKMLRAIAEANSRTEAKQLRHRFVKRCGVRLADAGARVSSDWKQLTSFHAFPKEHWSQLRTTESIEAPLSAIRVRACGPKASKPAAHVEAILWKLLGAALRTMPLLDPLEMVPSLVRAKHSAKDAPVAASKRRAS